jgi:hypothetical protein
MSETEWASEQYITTWTQFNSTVYRQTCQLLTRLDEFPDAILVTGCQRSGTTMLSRVLTRSDGLCKYWFSPDDELDAALILSGYVKHRPEGRYCFQTTYVNACYHEYFRQLGSLKLIWVLRSPFSVIHSMLYNWRDDGLNTLFRQCGLPILTGMDRWRYRFFGLRGISRLRRACWAYTGKTAQLFELKQRLRADQVMVVDYDELVTHKRMVLPAIYDFADLSYRSTYADEIHAKSIDKKDRLSTRELATISELCNGVYQNGRTLLTDITPGEGAEYPFALERTSTNTTIDSDPHGAVIEREVANLNTNSLTPHLFLETKRLSRKALSEAFLRDSYQAFMHQQAELARDLLRKAIVEDRSILDAQGKGYCDFLIQQNLNDGDGEGRALESVFAQLPPELAWLSQNRQHTIARACLYRGIYDALNGRLEKADGFTGWVSLWDAEGDPEFITWFIQLLSQYEKEFGTERTNEMLNSLIGYLQAVRAKVDVRILAGRYHLKRAFEKYQTQDYGTVAADVLRALRARPAIHAESGCSGNLNSLVGIQEKSRTT